MASGTRHFEDFLGTGIDLLFGGSLGADHPRILDRTTFEEWTNPEVALCETRIVTRRVAPGVKTKNDYSETVGPLTPVPDLLGRFETDFDQDTARHRELDFVYESHSFASKDVLPPNQLMSHSSLILAAGFKGILHAPAADIVAKFGTHVITSCTFGGVLFAITGNESWKDGTSHLDADTATVVKWFKTEFNAKYSTAEIQVLSQMRVMALGGDPAKFIVKSPASLNEVEYNDWVASLQDPLYQTMIAYRATPIWEFIPDIQKREEVRAYVASCIEYQTATWTISSINIKCLVDAMETIEFSERGITWRHFGLGHRARSCNIAIEFETLGEGKMRRRPLVLWIPGGPSDKGNREMLENLFAKHHAKLPIDGRYGTEMTYNRNLGHNWCTWNEKEGVLVMENRRWHWFSFSSFDVSISFVKQPGTAILGGYQA